MSNTVFLGEGYKERFVVPGTTPTLRFRFKTIPLNQLAEAYLTIQQYDLLIAGSRLYRFERFPDALSGTVHLIADLKGDPGAAGVSPTVTVSKTGTVTTITITDATRTKTATINDGTDGKDGADYVLTDADKQEIAALVKSLCTTETWAFELEDGTTVTKDVLLV